MGGSDKTINVWKSGFYDSLNEKILENESVSVLGKSQKNINGAISKNNSIEEKKENSLKTTALDFSKYGKRTTTEPEIAYNHTEDNFEIMREGKKILIEEEQNPEIQ